MSLACYFFLVSGLQEACVCVRLLVCVLAESRWFWQAGLRWVEFGRGGGADLGTLSPALPSARLGGVAKGDRGVECVCVFFLCVFPYATCARLCAHASRAHTRSHTPLSHRW